MGNVQSLIEKLEATTLPDMPNKKDWKIGCIGSGFIMRDCHLVAYNNAGFSPYAISSRTKENAREVADAHSSSFIPFRLFIYLYIFIDFL